MKGLRGESISKYAEGEMAGLRYLNLSHNYINDEVSILLITALESDSYLHSLDMSGNQLEIGGGEEFVKLFEK